MSWFSKKTELDKLKPTFTIEVVMNQPGHGGYARQLVPQKRYQIILCQNEDNRAAIAHELGHCVESAMGRPWDDASLRVAMLTGNILRGTLEDEAAAWRFAVRMFPDIRSKIITGGYGSYVQAYRSGLARSKEFVNFLINVFGQP